MDENQLISLPAISIEDILAEASPFEQYNYFLFLDKIKDVLPSSALEAVRNVLPKIYLYDSLKRAFGILIRRKFTEDKVQLYALIQRTEAAWPGCPDRLKLCAAARRRMMH